MPLEIRFSKIRVLRQRGFTFIELMVASLITSVVAGGTFMALATAARLSVAQSSPAIGEAMGFAQESVERPRNHVAADDMGWFTSRVGSWQDDALSATPTGSESINQPPVKQAERRYCVVPADCDGVGPTDDCYRVEVRVCWNGTTISNCPAPGTPCP